MYHLAKGLYLYATSKEGEFTLNINVSQPPTTIYHIFLPHMMEVHMRFGDRD